MKDFRGRLIFKCYTGSKLYGTDDEKSDTDIKGVFLPELKDLVLGKAPKCYQFSTGDNHVKNSKEDTDETYYSLHYFLELLSKGDTNALDLFFAYTNYEKVLIDSVEWSELISNKDKLLTKSVKSYLGYCKNQSIKYSVKGEKLNNYKSFFEFLNLNLHKKDLNGKTISLSELLSDKIELKESEEYFENGKKIGNRFKQNIIEFGNHCYVLELNNKDRLFMISDIKINLKDDIKVSKDKIEKVIKSYGDRVNKVAQDKGVDYKALSHAVRVIFQVEELLKEGHITFPLKEREFIKSIKYKNTEMTFEEIIEWIEKKIEYIETELIPNSSLRNVSDFDWIENYLLKIYK